MKRIISILLSMAILLCGCSQNQQNVDNQSTESATVESNSTEVVQMDDNLEDAKLEFSSLADPELTQYVEDTLYADIVASLDSENYVVENVSAVYVSKEYLDELAYNSKSNLYFGYDLADIDAQFDGQKYVFSCSEDGQTIVKEYEVYDDTYDQMLRNVAIGAGVILVCVTVSVVSGGLGAPAVSMVFAAAAKTGTEFAVSSAILSGTVTAVVKGVETKDVKETVKAAALASSDGFKWGAISGVVTGGITETISIAKAAKAIPTPRQSEEFVLSQYGGEEQISYLAGEEVSQYTAGATRPDVVLRNADGTIEAIEVKNYNLANQKSRSQLYKELERQVTSRVENLPTGSTQRIVLDTRNRHFSDETVKAVVDNIRLKLKDIYPNIPIDVL